MQIDRNDTAVVFTDPQNEVLSETGLAWPLVRESLAENDTVENIGRIFEAAKRGGFEVFISPHYFYPGDAGWKIQDARAAEEPRRGLVGFERSIEHVHRNGARVLGRRVRAKL